MLTAPNTKPMCVVPSNLKFERYAGLTPSEAAEPAALLGSPLPSSVPNAGLPEFKPGVRLVFVAAPDDELAQFLVAQRANSIKSWQEFVGRYGSSARAAEARNSIAALHMQAAETAYGEYQKSVAAHSPKLGVLRIALQQAATANRVVQGYPPARKLQEALKKELDALLEPDRAALQAFQKAL